MTAVLLGLRLALASTNRWRSLAMVVAALTGGLILLATFAVARAELATATSFVAEVPRIMLAMVLAVGLPCALLVATVGRLAAAMRDRRLANLRLIGLTPNQTRVVGATESAAAAVLGTALAWPAWWSVQPLLADRGLAGRHWPADALWPAAVDQAIVALVLPALVAGLAVFPRRGSAQQALASVRRADRPAPGLWRLLPLATGTALCGWVIQQGRQQELSESMISVLLTGIALTGLGLILVIPVFMRISAAALLHFGNGPVARLTGRRLEAQPAGVTRVVSALLLGLFLVTGARFVLVAFESTPQYLSAARSIEREQRVVLGVDGAHAAAVTTRAASIQGVRDVLAIPILDSRCGSAEDVCARAMVISCKDLSRLAPELRGCRDDRVMARDEVFIGEGHDSRSVKSQPEIVWLAGDQDDPGSQVLTTPTATLTALTVADGHDSLELIDPLYADFVVPPSLVPDLPRSTWNEVLLIGGPGRDLGDLNDTVQLQNWPGDPGVTTTDYTYYDFVASMRAIVWAVAGVILAIGMLTFGIAAIDRGLERRREVVALQLVGVPGGILRRAQWLESVIPIGVGAVLAVTLGALAGATYLTIGDGLVMPWSQTGTLAGIAFLAAATVAALTVLASAPRIRPDQIRRE